MTRVTIELIGASELEVGEDWPELDRALRALGLSAEVRSRRPRRAATSEGLEIAVRLLETVESHVLDALVGAVVAAVSMRLSRLRRHKQQATVTIFGPDGKPLKQVKLPACDEHTSIDERAE